MLLNKQCKGEPQSIDLRIGATLGRPDIAVVMYDSQAWAGGPPPTKLPHV